MRHGRAKQARKTLQFFQRTVGLKQPYHVLLDGTFVVAFTQHNLPMQERVERILQVNQSSLVFVTTESVFQEVSTLVEKSRDAEKKTALQQALDWMKQNCSKRIDEIPATSLEWAEATRGAEDHLEELSAAGRDLLTVLTDCNGIHDNGDETEKVAPPLLVASQDESLLHLARRSGKVPVIRLARGSVLLLEQPSNVAQQSEQHAEREKWTVRGSVQDQEKLLVDMVKQKERQEQRRSSTGPNPHERRKKRKAKGPNPLSCKTRKDEKHKAKK